ncbi:MAG: hypothetical protein LJE56_07105 [Acidiferrobacterales bacterium]|jgi:hypothetical protein|nr:hypothetical protein [Acidiferrobacterales bacterium]
MPFEIHQKTDPAGIVIVYTGIATGQDIIDANEKTMDCEACTYQLSDFTGIDGFKVSPKELHKIAIQDCSIPLHYKLEKMALVGNKQKYARLADLYYTFVEIWVGKQRQYETRTFDTIEEARQWIGLK